MLASECISPIHQAELTHSVFSPVRQAKLSCSCRCPPFLPHSWEKKKNGQFCTERERRQYFFLFTMVDFPPRDIREIKVLGLGIFKSAVTFLSVCHQRTGRMMDLTQFQIKIVVDNHGIGTVTFTTKIEQLQQDLQGILPYRDMLFNTQLNAEKLTEMRRGIINLSTERWEKMRELGDRQRMWLQLLVIKLRDICRFRYVTVPEDLGALVDISVTFANSTPAYFMPVPTVLKLKYLGITLELVFPLLPLKYLAVNPFKTRLL